MTEKEIIQREINEAIDTRLDYSYLLQTAETKDEKEYAEKGLAKYNGIIDGMFQIARALSWCILTNSITGKVTLV